MTKLVSYEDIQQMTKGNRLLVFGGYSGLGYEDVDSLRATLAKRIQKEIDAVGVDRVSVVSGATADGIGLCYEVAKELGVKTFGIVSEAGKDWGAAKDCDHTFFVPIRDPNDPSTHWEVLDEQGKSYMVSVAQTNGTMVYYGGGDVAVGEIKEAQERNVSIEVDVSFNPNPEKVAKKQEKNPDMDPTPLRSYMEQHDQQSSLKMN